MPPRNEFIERLQAQSKERHREQAKLLRLKERIFDVAKTVNEAKKERKPKGRPKKEKKIVAKPIPEKKKMGRPLGSKNLVYKKDLPKQEKNLPISFTRPPAEYSNTSPYGIAAALRLGNNF